MISFWLSCVHSICQSSTIPMCVCASAHDACLIIACWLLTLQSLFQCFGIVPRHEIPLIHDFSSPGEISTRTTLDREQQSSYQLGMVVQDGGSPSRSTTGTAFITVLDDNDNDPVFTHSQSGKNLIIQVMQQDTQKHRQDRKGHFFRGFVDQCVF